MMAHRTFEDDVRESRIQFSGPRLAWRACPVDGKRIFSSRRQARRATAAVHWRIRIYWCEDARGWHVTNGDKRNRRP